MVVKQNRPGDKERMSEMLARDLERYCGEIGVVPPGATAREQGRQVHLQLTGSHDQPKKPIRTLECAYSGCRTVFTTRHPRAIYCSKKCNFAASNQRQRERRAKASAKVC